MDIVFPALNPPSAAFVAAVADALPKGTP